VFVTHRIDDALEIADRIFVLAAPAQVALEIHIDAELRKDEAAMVRLHEEIAKAIGGGEE
jgi:NitT/TauT family transport system ATP-binding protein